MKRFQLLVFLMIFPLTFLAQKPKVKKKEFAAAKLSITSIFVGDISPAFEHSFSKKLTYEVGAGLVTDNYVRNFFLEVPTVSARRSVVGPTAFGSLRYYPYRLGEGLYFSGELKYRLYRKKFSQDGGSLIINEYHQYMIPRFGIGFTVFTDEKLFFDISANTGLGFEKYFRAGDTMPVKAVRLHFGIGVKVGYAFKHDK
jgi:hypothetical protein